MSTNLGSDNFKDWGDLTAQPLENYSSLSENFAVGVGEMVDESLSLSSILHDPGISDRDDDIRSLVSEGVIPEELIESFSERSGRGRRVKYNDVAKYLNDSGFENHIPTDEELIEERDNVLNQRRNYRDSISSTSTTGGDIARFAGSFVGASLDPINMAFVGVTPVLAGARSMSKTMYSLNMAARGAAINAGTATVIEPFVFSWKEEIGAEYTLEDSIFNIGASGLFGGSVNGLGAAISRRFLGDTFLGKDRKSLVGEFLDRGASKEEADEIVDFIQESADAPVRDVPAEEFVRASEETQDDMNYSDLTDDYSFDDVDDIQKLDAALEDIDDTFVYTDMEGNKILLKESDMKYDTEVEELRSKLECMRDA